MNTPPGNRGMAAKYDELNAAAREANRKRGLPRLVGTDGQVGYAESIRANFVDALRLTDEEARATCSFCVIATVWISLGKRGSEPHVLAEVLRELKFEIDSNRKAGFPRISSADAETIWRIETCRAFLRQEGDRLGIASDAVLAVMSKLNTQLDWEPFVELQPEAWALRRNGPRSLCRNDPSSGAHSGWLVKSAAAT